MMLVGKIFKSGRYWAAEASSIGVYTQGTTRADAEAMLADAVREVVNREGFTVSVSRLQSDDVSIGASSPHLLAAQVLKYQREVHKLSLADVALRLGAKSRNAYAAYEQGKTEPTLSKYLELLAVVAPEMALTVAPRSPQPNGVAIDGKKRVARSVGPKTRDL